MPSKNLDKIWIKGSKFDCYEKDQGRISTRMKGLRWLQAYSFGNCLFWQFSILATSILATFNFDSFWFWQLSNFHFSQFWHFWQLSILSTFNCGNLQFWQLSILTTFNFKTFSFDNFQFRLFSSKIFGNI